MNKPEKPLIANKLADSMERREFITKIPLAFACLAILSCESAPNPEPRPRKVSLGSQGSLDANLSQGFAILTMQRLVLVKDNAGYAAMSLICTHQECLLRGSPVDGGYQCPCHGSTFGALGQLENGPAKQSLPWFELSRDIEGIIFADLGKTVSAEWRLPAN